MLELDFHEREKEYMRQKKRKNELREELAKSEKEKECTFKPNIRLQGEAVSFNDFLRKQEEHIKRKQDFLAERQKEKDDEEVSTVQPKPSISDYSKQLAKPQEPAHERLYTKAVALSPAREKATQRAGVAHVPEVGVRAIWVDVLSTNHQKGTGTAATRPGQRHFIL